MPVGRLTGLAAHTTLASSTSASVTIPSDGTVTTGDLLIVGCVMPSGSRTFTISGGGGAWASLGTAAQAGHTSQVWWRIATPTDLGATVTVTPSTGGIRQVLLLGKVTGAHPTTPVAASQGVTTTTGTTKTTPTLGSVPAGCRDVSLVWDSRGASTPNTAVWTPPAGVTRQLQASTTDGSGASSGAIGDSDTTVTGTAGNRTWTPDQPAVGSAWTLAIAPGATEAPLTSTAESATARALTPAKARTLQTPSEAGTARALTGGKAHTLSAATHTSAARLATATKTGGLSPAPTAEQAQSLTGQKATILSTTLEHDDSPPLAASGESLLGAPAEQDTAHTLTSRKHTPLAVPAAAETALAPSGRKTLALAPAVETATAAAPAHPSGASDIDYTVSEPAGGWATGVPTSRWTASAPAARWEVNAPWT